MVYAQVTVTAGGGNSAVTGGLGGPGLTISNVTINCPNNAYGQFSNGASSGLGVNAGFMITTGSVTQFTGANANDDFSTCNGTSGSDPDLLALSSAADQDLCVVEFDVVPQCATMSITFVFGSDEYTNWVNQNFNDAFGFFVSGPNPSGGNYTNLNIATIPNGTACSIDNVNHLTNTAFFVNNNAGTYSNSFDGFTTVLTPVINVTPCATYHFKLAIADAGDCFVDSGVLIDLIQCVSPWTVATSSTPAGCATNNGTATATVSGGIGPFSYTWSPAPGGGQGTATATGLAAGTYTVTVNDGLSCTPSQVFNVVVGSTGALPVTTVTPSTSICAGGSTTLTANGASTYAWSPTTGLSSGTGQTVTASPATTTTYTVTGTDACGSSTATTTVTVISNPAITATPGACNPANNQYTLTGQVSFTSAPTSGTLTVTNSCGGSQVFNAPFASPLNYSFPGLTSNGAGCTVTATFSAAPGCSSTQTYTAPAACNCSLTGVTAVPGACNPSTNQYTLTGQISFTNPPASGTLTVTNSCGGSQVFNAPFTSPLNYSIPGLTSNGAGCTVTATFSAIPSCTNTANYTAPPNCTCIINNFTANIGAPNCGATGGTYDVTGQVAFTNAPASGTLTVSSSCGGSQVFNAPFTSPLNYTISGINANGAACNMTAVFSANAACTQNIPYTAPICPCNMDSLVVNIGACDPSTNTYSVDVHLVFSSPPASGNLVVDVCGTQQTIPAPFTSPQNFTFTGLTTGVGSCTVNAFFSADPACTNSLTYIAPNNCLCPADAGTVTATMTGSGITNYILCENDIIDIVANGDAVPPNDEGAGFPAPYNPDLGFLIYSCPPTMGLDPNLDPCFVGVMTGGTSMTDINDLLIINSFPAGTFTNNTVYYSTFTFYDVSTFTFNANCFDIGPPTAVTYLPPITSSGVENCQAGTVTVTVSGGYPQLLGGNFTASGLTPANAVFNNTTAANNGTITISGLLDGQNYSFTITDQNGCPHTFSGGPFNGPPVANAGPDVAACLNDPVTLTATGGGTYAWSNGANTASTTVTPPSTQNFIVTVNDGTGCIDTDTVQVIINAVFDATITPAGPFCESNASVTLNAADPGGTWSGPGITNASTGVFDPAVAGPGTHTIQYLIPGACGDTSTINITINPDADATINPSGPYCQDDPAVTLTGIQAGGTWSGPGITNAASGTFDPSTAGNGTHTITYTIGGACGDVQTTSITVNDIFDATITPAGPFCTSTAPATLAAADPGGTWSGPGITNAATGIFDPSVAGPGTHTIQYLIAGSCGDTATTTIQVIQDADATITPAGPYCILDNAVNLVAADPGGIWSGTGITSAANGTFDPGVSGPGNFTITYSISGVCGDVQTTNISVVNQIAATINAAGPFCENAVPTALTAVNPGGTWSGPGITNSSTGMFDPSVAGPGTHTITYITSGNCSDTSTINIVVNPLPVIDFTVDNASGCTPLTVTFTDNTNMPGATVLWDFDGGGTSTTTGSVTNTFVNPGCYNISLTVTSAQGCSSSLTNNNMVCVFANPVADFAFSPQPTTILQPEITFTNLSVGAATYSWNFAGLGSSTLQHPIFVFPADTAMTYTVCLDVLSANGCPDNICHDVIISEEFLIYVPNAFTPDADGVNDIFYPVITGYEIDNFTLMIFNRWGELIYETELASKGWDGTHKGQKCKEDVYVWKIKAKEQATGDKRAFYGHVTLLR